MPRCRVTDHINLVEQPLSDGSSAWNIQITDPSGNGVVVSMSDKNSAARLVHTLEDAWDAWELLDVNFII